MRQEPSDKSHGDRMAGVVDPAGITWWLAMPLARKVSASANALTLGDVSTNQVRDSAVLMHCNAQMYT